MALFFVCVFIRVYVCVCVCVLTPYYVVKSKLSPLGGLEPPTFRLTAERANQLRHRGCVRQQCCESVLYCSTTFDST